jgi:hypothetical protein
MKDSATTESLLVQANWLLSSARIMLEGSACLPGANPGANKLSGARKAAYMRAIAILAGAATEALVVVHDRESLACGEEEIAADKAA